MGVCVCSWLHGEFSGIVSNECSKQKEFPLIISWVAGMCSCVCGGGCGGGGGGGIVSPPPLLMGG